VAARRNPQFAPVAAKLRAVLRTNAGKGLTPRVDKPGTYALIGPPTESSRGKDVWFGAVTVGKSYVGYHLMPVYAFPKLLRDVSPALRKRMQGKSCFNFTEVDGRLFAELARLTKKGYREFRRAKLIR
jgi:hypothetical protein